MPQNTGPSYPPLDFSCFEQQDYDVVERWLEFIEGEDGLPIWSVTLGAVRNGDSAPTFVKTMPRDRFQQLMVGDGSQSADAEAAFDAVRTVVNYSMALGVDADDTSSLTFERVQPTLTRFIVDRASQFETWETVEVAIDHAMVTCSVWEFAGWRCAVTFSPPERYAMVYSRIDARLPDSLVTTHGLAGYGLEPHRPIDFYTAVANSADSDRWRPADSPDERFLHADFYQTMNTDSI
jgi:hypothetical protein